MAHLGHFGHLWPILAGLTILGQFQLFLIIFAIFGNIEVRWSEILSEALNKSSLPFFKNTEREDVLNTARYFGPYLRNTGRGERVHFFVTEKTEELPIL